MGAQIQVSARHCICDGDKDCDNHHPGVDDVNSHGDVDGDSDSDDHSDYDKGDYFGS